jgi:ABC-type uncharacterized transport system ATPase subunit
MHLMVGRNLPENAQVTTVVRVQQVIRETLEVADKPHGKVGKVLLMTQTNGQGMRVGKILELAQLSRKQQINAPQKSLITPT